MRSLNTDLGMHHHVSNFHPTVIIKANNFENIDLTIKYSKIILSDMF